VPFRIYTRPAVTTPRTVKFFRDLRKAEAKDLPLGVAGFCFGGFFVFQLAKDPERVDGKPLIDCGFTAHPSFLTVPKDGEEAKLPVSVSIGDDDMALKSDKAYELQKVFEKNPVEHEMVIIPGVKHGFAVRWNPHDEKENKHAQEAEDQAVNWYKKHFKI
jgi:dienelactone hydrolase